ncbi:MAG: pyridoxal phosphate-dependent aminotransferase [Desulfobacterales bacterium]|nr:pyridoxal phosphate-dependent aminotransferase [Desulfobacterales bacterium]
MELAKKQEHQRLLNLMFNPEQRVAYYLQHIAPEMIDLSTAENVLLFDFYQKNAFDCEKRDKMEVKDILYATPYGSDEYRKSVAELLRKSWELKKLDWNDLFAVSGVSAALECLAFALFKKGDAAIFPAPLWYGFPWSFDQRPEMKFVPFQLEAAGIGKFELTLEDVMRAYDETTPNPRVLVLTNPNNPLGVNYTKELLERIYAWALKETDMHIISDEIYFFSQPTTNADTPPFVNAWTLDAFQDAPVEDQNRVHVVWGLAKDFGLSGFKVGFVVSKSPKVKDALKGVKCDDATLYKTMAWFSPFDSLKQYMLKPLFLNKESGRADPALAEKAMYEYSGKGEEKSLLTMQFNATKEQLAKRDIKYFTKTGSAIFFWLDLREYLDKVPNKPGEISLYPHINQINPKEERLESYIREEGGVSLIPGTECFNEEPGYFRLCYTAQKKEKVIKGIEQMANALKKLG